MADKREIVQPDFPPCYGHMMQRGLEEKCAECEWEASCHVYSYSRGRERSRAVHFNGFKSVPFEQVKGMDVEKALESACERREDHFSLPNGRRIDLSEVNMTLMKISIWLTLEFPDTMKAFALKLDPSVRSLEDMACILHTSKQLLHKRIMRECGVGSVPQRGRRTGKTDKPQENKKDA